LEDDGPVVELAVLVVEEPVEPVEPVGVGNVEVVVVGVQDADTLFTGPTPAGTICEAGVPGGTLTLKDSVCPVSSVTVTVHWSAEATGIAAIPRIAKTKAAVSATVLSFRRVDNVTRLLPPWASHMPRRNVAVPAS
jgi:hypothetical protein